MLLFTGDLQKATALTRIYRIPDWEHVVFASVSDGVGTFVEGRRVSNIADIPGKDVEHAIILGGNWIYQPFLQALTDAEVPADRVLTGAQPDRVHAALLAAASQPVNGREIGFRCVYEDVFHRPWYAWPMVVMAAIMERMEIESSCAVEFGVFTGDGLRNMASIAAFIHATIGKKIHVLGFDTGSGLPSVADWRDHPELWQTGELVMPDMKAVEASVPSHTKLIIGDISETLDGAFREYVSSKSPLGFVSLDVDTYSSSVSCLRAFEIASDHLLPVIPMYVDDSYVNISQTRFAGEALAITEFNDRNECRKIDKKVIRTDRPQQPWHHTMYFAHIFDHPMRAGGGEQNLINLNHFYF